MSLSSILSIARSALLTQQLAMEVTANNVANANTPGYSRQTLQLTPGTPVQFPLYSVGSGVDAAGITRSRSQFYDASYRTDNGLLGQSSTLNGYLSQIEGALNEPSDNGLSAALSGMFGSLSDLSNDPANPTNRDVVVSSATRVVNVLHSMNTQITTADQNALTDMRTQVDQVNQLTTQIAQLNQQITASNRADGSSSDLEDQRDNLIDQLSQYMNVRVTQHDDGSASVAAGDTLLVDGSQSSGLSVGTVGQGWGLFPAGGGAQIDAQTGTLAALADLTQNRIPAVVAGLDKIANSLVTEFNAIHEQGYTASGATGIDFFDPTGTTAGTIQLSAALQASSDNLAVSANGQPGNGDIASQLAAFSTTGAASLGGQTFGDAFTGLATQLGTDVNSTGQDATANQALVSRDDQARTSVSGVSSDEEMVALINEQQAYQAAARLVSVADQMSQDLMTLIGT